MEEHGRHRKSWKYIIDNANVYRDVYRAASVNRAGRVVVEELGDAGRVRQTTGLRGH